MSLKRNAKPKKVMAVMAVESAFVSRGTLVKYDFQLGADDIVLMCECVLSRSLILLVPEVKFC